MSRFLFRVGIGILVSFPIVCVAAGGVEEALLVLLISIVCTAGAGLVVWVPAWWLLGWGAIAAVAWGIDKYNGVETAEVVDSPAPSHSNQALREYLRQATANGIDSEEATCRLVINGWDMSDIQAARRDLLSTQSKAL